MPLVRARKSPKPPPNRKSPRQRPSLLQHPKPPRSHQRLPGNPKLPRVNRLWKNLLWSRNPKARICRRMELNPRQKPRFLRPVTNPMTKESNNDQCAHPTQELTITIPCLLAERATAYAKETGNTLTGVVIEALDRLLREVQSSRDLAERRP